MLPDSFFAMRSIDSQLDFDLTLATEKSNENPVYYIQYAHARICSIMRQLAEENVVEAAAADYNLLTDATELELIKNWANIRKCWSLRLKNARYNRVAHYVHDLAGLFHSFYNQCRILVWTRKCSRHGSSWYRRPAILLNML